MIRALWTYLKARFRMIGRCPPHRYTDKQGQHFGFCLDCGEYPWRFDSETKTWQPTRRIER